MSVIYFFCEISIFGAFLARFVAHCKSYAQDIETEFGD